MNLHGKSDPSSNGGAGSPLGSNTALCLVVSKCSVVPHLRALECFGQNVKCIEDATLTGVPITRSQSKTGVDAVLNEESFLQILQLFIDIDIRFFRL